MNINLEYVIRLYLLRSRTSPHVMGKISLKPKEPGPHAKMNPRRLFVKSELSGVILLLVVLFTFPASGQPDSVSTRFRIRASTGFSMQSLDWSIAGKNAYGESVDIRSELKWTDIGGLYLRMDGEMFLWKGLSFRMGFANTFVTSGIVYDSDFDKSNRQERIFHEMFDASMGRVISYHTSLGYEIRILEKHLLAPFAGYRSNSDRLFMLRDYGNVRGNLETTYETFWRGLLVGAYYSIRVREKVDLKGQLAYSNLDYFAQADWNLVDEFQHPVSFEHKAKGYALAIGTELHYAVTSKMSVFLSGLYGYSVTGQGKDILYRKTGEIQVTRLNEVERKNFSIAAGIELRW